MKNADTIFAVASGPGKAGVKIFRISGVGAFSVAEAFGITPLAPRAASLRKIRHPVSFEEIDQGLAIWFPGPASFTGEDCLELQVHGGRAVEQALLKALAQTPGCRLAEAGEFAWRAFVHEKLDLTAVEGLADLIDAETDLQRRQALGQVNGKLFALASNWRKLLLSCLALVEGSIDFEDEADVPQSAGSAIVANVEPILVDLRRALADFSRAELTREGFCVVILGPANAGKSSLLNSLINREAAIVAPAPGTTRDLIEATLDLDGCSIVFVDTAGLRPTDDPVERMGIERARARARKAQLILWLAENLDADPAPSVADYGVPVVPVQTKADLRPLSASCALAISTVTGFGLSELLDLVSARARSEVQAETPAILTRTRHFSSVAAAAASLEAIDVGTDLELIAEDLRHAARHLETLTGRIDSEDVLGDIFSRFCVGK